MFSGNEANAFKMVTFVLAIQILFRDKAFSIPYD